MTDKEKYIEFSKIETDIPIFMQWWWMDAVCMEGEWNVVLCERNHKIVGCLIFFLKKKFGLRYVTQPPLTQKNGIFIKYPQGLSFEKRISFEKDVINELINKFEKYKLLFYIQSFDHVYTNWLPFYWKGYKQSTCYTYRLEDISNIENVISRFDYSKRNDLKFALKQNFLIKYGEPTDSLYAYHKKVLAKQGKTISYSKDLLQRIINVVFERKCGKIIYIMDDLGNIHSSIFVIWDKMTSYNLITAIDPDFRKSRSSVLLFKEAIVESSKYVNIFDFEGSMIESVESSYRKFGTIQTPYNVIKKIYSKNVFLKFLIANRF